MGSRIAVIAALLSSLVLGMGVAAAQSVPLPVPAPQSKSQGKSAAPRPPAAVAPAPAQQPQQSSSGFPSIFQGPAALFGKSGETTAFDAKQRALVDRVSAYLSGIRQLHAAAAA